MFKHLYLNKRRRNALGELISHVALLTAIKGEIQWGVNYMTVLVLWNNNNAVHFSQIYAVHFSQMDPKALYNLY